MNIPAVVRILSAQQKSSSFNASFAIVLASIALIGPLAIHLFLPVIPELKTALGMSDALAQLAFSITLFAMSFMTLVYGGLSDRYGRRPVLLTGLGLFLAGSALCAVADTAPMLVLGRLFQAMGAGCGIALARAIARDAYGPETLVKAIAYLTMAYTLGPMIAPAVGGALVDGFGWRSVFGFALLAGGLITVAAVLVLYETLPSSARGQGPTGGILRSYLRLFKQPLFTAYVLQSGFASGTFFAMASATTFLMQDYLGRPASEYGIYFLFCPIGYCLGTVISSRLSGRVPVERMVLIGSILLLATVIGQDVFVLSGILVPLVLFIPGCLISVAQGIALPNAQAGAIRAVPELAGTAAGIGVFLQMGCGAAFSQLHGLLADGTPIPMVIVVSISASLAFVAGIASFVLARRSPAKEKVVA